MLNHLREKINNTVNIKEITSVLILLLIIPFFVLAGKPGGEIFSNVYNYIFISILGLALFYGIFEIANFIFPMKSHKLKFLNLFFISGLLYFILFLWFNIEMALNAQDQLSFAFVRGNFSFGLAMSLTIVIFLITMIVGFIYKDNFQNLLIYGLISFLLFFFLTSLSYVTINFGWTITFLFIFVVSFTDIFAYLGGKKFGKTKAFPNVSPNKTVEGLLTGYLIGIGFGIIWSITLMEGFDMTFINLRTYWLVFITIVIALVAPFGDLFFSKIKRIYGKKDFSNLIPGHGGLLDRIDSHIMAFSLGSIFLVFFSYSAVVI